MGTAVCAAAAKDKRYASQSVSGASHWNVGAQGSCASLIHELLILVKIVKEEEHSFVSTQERSAQHLSQSMSFLPRAATEMGDSHLKGLCHAFLIHAEFSDTQRHQKWPQIPMSKLFHLFLFTDSHLHGISSPAGPFSSHLIPFPRSPQWAASP